MFLLNLTWLQFAALFAGISAGVVTLYLWDRSKRRVRVATLRFWQASERAAEVKHRKRIQQPLSLLLQLLGIALLLLALAQPRLGPRGPVARDHVLLLDTSAWMAARVGQRTLMEEAVNAARAYVHALPAGDRLMVVRADALATPVTSFETNRELLDQAISASRAGSTALNLDQAAAFAGQAQELQSGARGEIVYAGPGRTAEPPHEGRATRIDRILPIDDAVPSCGLRRIGVQRSSSDADAWDILVAVRNYGASQASVQLVLSFSGSPAGARMVTIPPVSEQNVAFQYRTRAAGVLEARLMAQDSFPADDRAAVELPGQRPLNVVVYSDEPEPLRPVLAANPLVHALFRKTAEYRQDSAADVLLLDRFNPPVKPETDAIWIQPPAGSAPVRLRTTVANAPITTWRTDHPLAAGLRAKDLRLDSAEVFAPSEGQVAVADVESGPVIVARAEKPKMVVLGFHPVHGALRYELTTPLLFANILRWMAPDIFRRWELNAGSPGTITVELAGDTAPEGLRVIGENGTDLPYTLEGRNLRFFTGSPGTVRVIAGDREMVYSCTLPELADAKWTAPAGTRRGVPRGIAPAASDAEIWPWLALAGALGFLLEWMLFGRSHFGAGIALRGPKSIFSFAWRGAR